MPEEKFPEFKRRIAYKMRIGNILAGKPILEAERFKFLEYTDKQIVRVNVIANIIEKFVQDEEKKYATLTLDDASGQILLKTFGEDIEKLSTLSQGDTIQIIGLLRSWNNELYILPEIIKKKEPAYLLVRKLELDLEKPKTLEKSELHALKDQITQIIKREETNGGAEIESIILELKSPPTAINQEIKKLLEEGIAYEPRPGKVRYLG
ncbi:MAG: OB-fold nucleic acid binding domain-containing protein [Nanoarchaeota archaeon]|nr:OB-fold nucleic acid binding domain-containing protein [Nanoarchaeota archaeon]